MFIRTGVLLRVCVCGINERRKENRNKGCDAKKAIDRERERERERLMSCMIMKWSG